MNDVRGELDNLRGAALSLITAIYLCVRLSIKCGAKDQPIAEVGPERQLVFLVWVRKKDSPPIANSSPTTGPMAQNIPQVSNE